MARPKKYTEQWPVTFEPGTLARIEAAGGNKTAFIREAALRALKRAERQKAKDAQPQPGE